MIYIFYLETCEKDFYQCNVMMKDQSKSFCGIFDRVLTDYHKFDDIFHSLENPFEKETIEFILYEKCVIDTRQWHMEDEIRSPWITPAEGMRWKKQIDQSNQKRTDLVERIDDYYFNLFRNAAIKIDARLNTESPAWAIDRLSILAIKIYHMKIETERKEADEEHITKCKAKLDLLLQQRQDLSTAIDELLDDYKAGRKKMKVYRQVKMYNDPALNPVLYKKNDRETN